MKLVIITGASSGIGKEFVSQLDRSMPKDYCFWLIARRKPLLEEVCKSMKHPYQCFALDVNDERQLTEVANRIQSEKHSVERLINCAGYGLMGPFLSQNRTDALGMIQTNCVALTNCTYLFLPFMKRGSRIIQLASSAAFLPQADFAVYAATKSYVLSFSRALHEELKDSGIIVTAVCPGPVDTAFFDIAEKTGKTLALKKLTMIQPKQVVKKALKASERKKAISVSSFSMYLFLIVSNILPHSFLLYLTALLKKMQR